MSTFNIFVASVTLRASGPAASWGAADQTKRRANTHDAVCRRWRSYGVDGVGANARNREVSSHTCAGGATRPARRAGQVIGIERLPLDRANRFTPDRELVQVRL